MTLSVAGLIGFATVGLSAVMFLKAVDVRRPQSYRSNAESPRAHVELVYIPVNWRKHLRSGRYPAYSAAMQ